MVGGFDFAFDFLIGAEGGYVDHPADPGGATKYGISQRAYPNEDIANLTLDRAKELYRRDYWQAIGADTLPPELALVAFDAAVNNGVGRAKGWLLLAKQQTSRSAQVAEFMAQRLKFMAGLSTWSVFGMGWSRRLATVAVAAGGILGSEPA